MATAVTVLPATLSEADTLRELFERDPLLLTHEDFAAMCDWARRERAKWAQEESTARSEGRRPRSKVAALPAASASPDPENFVL